MIKFLSSWSKSIGITIVIISILEMLIPNNKLKKYIKVVMGIYIIFIIINPFINNKELLNIKDINLDKYSNNNTIKSYSESSVENRIEELSKKEIEKDIVNKLSEKGFEIKSCVVDLSLNKEKENSINRIEIVAKKSDNKDITANNTENKLITEIEKIKKIGIKQENNENELKKERTVTNSDIKIIKDFLTNEYGVDEKCLKIN